MEASISETVTREKDCEYMAIGIDKVIINWCASYYHYFNVVLCDYCPVVSNLLYKKKNFKISYFLSPQTFKLTESDSLKKCAEYRLMGLLFHLTWMDSDHDHRWL